MFEALKGWREATGGSTDAVRSLAAVGGDGEDRGSTRFDFAGAEVFIFRPDDQCFRLRLRNVSCTGLSGLTDAPLSVGELVLVQFEETLMPAAHVTWTRNSSVGLEMVNPLPIARMQSLNDRHAAGASWSPAMRAASDLGMWWTDVDEVEKGRRPAAAREPIKRSARAR